MVEIDAKIKNSRLLFSYKFYRRVHNYDTINQIQMLANKEENNYAFSLHLLVSVKVVLLRSVRFPC